MSEDTPTTPAPWPQHRVVRVGASPMNPKVKWADLTCGHTVWRYRKPRIGSSLACDQCPRAEEAPRG